MSAATVAHRVGVAAAGSCVIVVGLVLVPLPGPGWPVVFAGFAVLGTEFAWARRIAEPVRSRVRCGMEWSAARPWPVRVAVGIALALSALGPLALLAF